MTLVIKVVLVLPAHLVYVEMLDLLDSQDPLVVLEFKASRAHPDTGEIPAPPDLLVSLEILETLARMDLLELRVAKVQLEQLGSLDLLDSLDSLGCLAIRGFEVLTDDPEQ